MKRLLKWAKRVLIGSFALFLLSWIALEIVVRMEPFPVDDLLGGFPESVRLYDREGQLLREVVGKEGARAVWMELDNLSPLVLDATLAVEDARFYQHAGIDWPSIVRAMGQNLWARRIVSGASTITMQLSRLVHPHPRRTLEGKLGEALDALRMERVVDKKTILVHYLNRAFYGSGAIGVEAASQRYFDKPSKHLSLAEAALLAGLPKAPSDLNPHRHPEAAKDRQRLVLLRMLQTGKISNERYQRALSEPITLAMGLRDPSAMHFTDYVLAQGPLSGEVKTTLDLDLQEAAEAAVRAHVESLADGGVTNAAVVVLDNRSCEILSMVGSDDYWATDGGAVNGATARRQPGSALKPFTYALAFEQGFSPASVVADIETRYGAALADLFSPRNYNDTFSGPILMGEALARSLNVPAIRVAQHVGVGPLLDRLHRAGFSSLDRSAEHYGLGLTLGNGEVTLLELAQAYAMFARRGNGCRATSIPKDAKTGRVFDESISFLITNILQDEGMRIAAFGPSTALLVGFPVAIKTGTSSNWRDNWAIGYTSRYTVAVWTGDFHGRSLNQLAGATGAGPLLHRMIHLVADRDDKDLATAKTPAEIAKVEVCAVSGRRATDRCPKTRTVHLLERSLPQAECPWHKTVRIDRRNGLLASKRCPKGFVAHRVFEVLPPAYARWQAEFAAQDMVAPKRYSPHCPKEGLTRRAVVITYPRAGEVFLIEPGYARHTQTLPLRAEIDPEAPAVTWMVDGLSLPPVAWPYEGNWPLEKGQHELLAVANGMKSDPISFEVR